MEQPLDWIPLWVLFLLLIAMTIGAVEAGYWLGGYRRRTSETEKETTIGPVVGASLGLLAFFLAFVFGVAASRFDARRQMVVEEANAIGTAYLRAGLLPEPHRTKLRDLLRKYVDVRMEAVSTGDYKAGMSKSVALHDQLWTHAEALAKEDPHSIVSGLFITSLNEVIDLHSKRLLIGVRSRLPLVIWGVLLVVSVLSIGMIGYCSGIAGSRRSLAVSALVLAFSAVTMMIVDLDRPREGMLQVGQHPMIELKRSMTAPTESVDTP